MNLSQLLLIDAVIVITVIPFLFLHQSKNKKSPFIRSSKKEDLLEKTSINLPDKEKLLQLEKLAISQGSGIEFDLLLGNWKFVTVWKKENDEKDSVFSSLLRVFSAKLELKKSSIIDQQLKLSITASIQFGFVSIEFSGNGYLKGKQPCMPFFLNLIELKSGSSIILSKSLKEPLEKEKSFFALIAIGENCRWLSARGQGGALILWMKD